MRGRGPPRRVEGARRGGRQRQLPRWPPRAAGATSRPPTTCRRCSSRAADAPRASGWRSRSRRPTPKRCRSPTAVVRRRAVDLRRDVRAEPRAQAASELLRVCRSGGKIGLANWTPRGFIGQLFAVVGRHVPPPAALTPAFALGRRERTSSISSSASASSIHTTPRDFAFRYRSPQHWIDVFRTWYGPVHKAFAASVRKARRNGLERDLVALIARLQHERRSSDGGPGRVPGSGHRQEIAAGRSWFSLAGWWQQRDGERITGSAGAFGNKSFSIRIGVGQIRFNDGDVELH